MYYANKLEVVLDCISEMWAWEEGLAKVKDWCIVMHLNEYKLYLVH